MYVVTQLVSVVYMCLHIYVLQRGWTTWTTAAVDDRVIGQAPMVMSLLQIPPVSIK